MTKWVILALLDLALLVALLISRAERLTENIWAVKLGSGCEMHYHTSIGAVALACPGVDYMRLWPLPVVQPWQSTPDPIDGWIARRHFLFETWFLSETFSLV